MARLRMPRAIVVAAFAVAVYTGVIAAHLMSGGDLRDYILLWPHRIEQSHASQAIRIDPHYSYLHARHGYDGQFFYFIAVDPLRARYYVDGNVYGADAAAYRYGRILYPMAARALAFGHVEWVPATLLLVNLLGVGLGTLVTASWLLHASRTPWLALLFSFYPGVALGILRDLADPLAFSLLAVAVHLFRFGGRYRLLWSASVFALAALTRETSLLVALVYALWLCARRDFRGAAILAFIASFPLLLWRMWLLIWLGSVGMPGRVGPVLPFTGIVQEWSASQAVQLTAIVVPALAVAGLALALWLRERGPHSPDVLVLLGNVALFVVALNPTSYADIYGSARMAIGVPLFTLRAMPRFLEAFRTSTWGVVAISAALWAVAIAVPS